MGSFLVGLGGTGPNWFFSALTRSGRECSTCSPPSTVGASDPIEGAASNLEEVGGAGTFLRFTALGTKAVASFLKSRSWGAEKTVAAASSAAAVGFSGSEGFGGSMGLEAGFAGNDG